MIKAFTQHIATMREAQAESRRVEQANAAAVAENSRRRKRGQKILKLPHKKPEWVVALYKQEDLRKKELSLLTPEEWLDRIERLNSPLKERVAAIVWWDYFSHRVVAERWPHLDEYLKPQQVTEVKNKDLAQGLYAVGYTPWEATRRAEA